MTTELYKNEMLFAEKILLDKAKLEQENKQLKESLDFLLNKFKKVNTANRNAKKLIRKALVEADITGNGTLNLNKLLKILGDKE